MKVYNFFNYDDLLNTQNKDMEILIFTENGKPVYTSSNEEYKMSSKIATFTIILNKCKI